MWRWLPQAIAGMKYWLNRNGNLLCCSKELVSTMTFLNKKLTIMYGIGRLMNMQYEDVIERITLRTSTRKIIQIISNVTKKTNCNIGKPVDLRKLKFFSLSWFKLNISRWNLLFKGNKQKVDDTRLILCMRYTTNCLQYFLVIRTLYRHYISYLWKLSFSLQICHWYAI